jgi:hydroxylysine kinase
VPDALFDVMTLPAPAIDAATAVEVASAWGLSGTATAQSGERDRNFRLDAADGRRFLLKFANPAEDAGFRALQVATLRHLEAAAPALPVPRVVTLPDGAVELPVPYRGGTAWARLLTWVPGVPVSATPRSAAQRAAHGRMLARLQAALAGFAHPEAARHEIVWDLAHLARLPQITHAIPDAAARAIVHRVVDRFLAEVAPAIPALPRQLVHNDLHLSNVLADPDAPDTITGLIDFGDITTTARVFDVAIATVSQPPPGHDRATAWAEFLAAFHAERPLTAQEIALIPLLIAVRTALGTALVCWHHMNQPDAGHFTLDDAFFAARAAITADALAPATAEQFTKSLL